MIMNMLGAGGMELVTDRVRHPDDDNPRGYFEYEPVKGLAGDISWLPDARGRAVKIISQLLYELPASEQYRIIFVNRNMDEVLASQKKMLQRRGIADKGISDNLLAAKFADHLDRIGRWIGEQKHMRRLTVQYDNVVAAPMQTAVDIARFLGLPLDMESMAGAVDPSLYRNRGPS